MQLPMTYLERKIRGDTTLVIYNGRIFEPDYMEEDKTHFIDMGGVQTAMIDGPSLSNLEDLWGITYKAEINDFMQQEMSKFSDEKIKGTKLEDEIIRTELKSFIVFKVFSKFVSKKGAMAKALGKIKSEFKQQEKTIQNKMKKHLKGEMDEKQFEDFGKELLKQRPVKRSDLAKKLKKRLGRLDPKDAPKESLPDIAEERDKESVFSTVFNTNMLIIDDMVYILERTKATEAMVRVDNRHYRPSKTPWTCLQDMIDIYRENIVKKYHDLAFLSQPRLKKLKEMQMLLDEELKRPVYKEKMLEIEETDDPGTMWAILGFKEFVNIGEDGRYYLFPAGKIAVRVAWRNDSIANGMPVNWGFYYAPNISGDGNTKTTLCLNDYSNERKKLSREAKIADYLSHAVRTMQHGYVPGRVRVYHSLNSRNENFRKMRISKSEIEERGLKVLNL